MTRPILHRVGESAPGAIEECLDAFGDLVWSLARRFCSNAVDAEDAVQDIFADIWRNAHRFDPALSAEKTFVAMIARRRLIDLQRRATRRRPTRETAILTDVPVPDEGQRDVETRDEADRVKEAIATLRPEQRQALLLSVCEGFTHQEVADRLGQPLGTVKTHIRRGLLKVRDVLQTSHAGGEGMGR